jgi:hypothetical protein
VVLKCVVNSAVNLLLKSALGRRVSSCDGIVKIMKLVAGWRKCNRNKDCKIK